MMAAEIFCIKSSAGAGSGQGERLSRLLASSRSPRPNASDARADPCPHPLQVALQEVLKARAGLTGKRIKKGSPFDATGRATPCPRCDRCQHRPCSQLQHCTAKTRSPPGIIGIVKKEQGARSRRAARAARHPSACAHYWPTHAHTYTHQSAAPSLALSGHHSHVPPRARATRSAHRPCPPPGPHAQNVLRSGRCARSLVRANRRRAPGSVRRRRSGRKCGRSMSGRAPSPPTSSRSRTAQSTSLMPPQRPSAAPSVLFAAGRHALRRFPACPRRKYSTSPKPHPLRMASFAFRCGVVRRGRQSSSLREAWKCARAWVWAWVALWPLSRCMHRCLHCD